MFKAKFEGNEKKKKKKAHYVLTGQEIMVIWNAHRMLMFIRPSSPVSRCCNALVTSQIAPSGSKWISWTASVIVSNIASQVSGVMAGTLDTEYAMFTVLQILSLSFQGIGWLMLPELQNGWWDVAMCSEGNVEPQMLLANLLAQTGYRLTGWNVKLLLSANQSISSPILLYFVSFLVFLGIYTNYT